MIRRERECHSHSAELNEPLKDADQTVVHLTDDSMYCGRAIRERSQ